MKIKALLILLFFTIIELKSQNKIEFEPVSSTGTIPSDILKKKSSKIKEALKESKAEHKDKKKSKQKKLNEFAAYNAYVIDELMLSGEVLYNDIYGIYLNKIKDELLKDDEELRNKITIYTLKSQVANAFTINDGKVFFNIGLIPYCKSEGEIAFVLAHEISHYTSKHSLKRFEKNDELIKSKGDIKKKAKFYESNQFSQEQEKEADKKALELLYKSKYKLSNALTSMEALEKTNYPLFNYKFDRNIISNSKLFFNNKYELDSVKPILLADDTKAKKLEEEAEEAEDKLKKGEIDKKKAKVKSKKLTPKEIREKKEKEKKDKKDAEDENVEIKETEETYNPLESTHPESPLRKKILADILKAENKDLTSGEDFILYNKAQFDEITLKSKIEITRAFLLNHSYELASYYAAGLLQLDSNNLYFKKLFAKSIGGFALYADNYWRYIHFKFHNMKGYYSDYLYMMYMMRKTDKALFLTTALNYCYKEYKKYPDDPELNVLCVALADKIYKEYKIDNKNFKDIEIPRENYTGTKPKKEVYKDEKSDINVFTGKKKKSTTEKRDDLVKTALVEYENEELFKSIFKEGKDYQKTRDKVTSDNKKDYINFINKNNVGTIKKVLIVQPQFYKFKQLDITSDKLVKHEVRSEEFNRQLEEAANLANVEVDFLDSKNLEENDVHKLNDLMRIQEYVTNMTNNDYVYKPNLIDIKFLDSLRDKYKTDHLMVVGGYPVDNSLFWPIFYSVFLYPLPYTIPELINAGKAFEFYAGTINLSTGDIDYYNKYTFKMKDNRLLESSIFYSFFNDIAHTKYRLEFNESNIKF